MVLELKARGILDKAGMLLADLRTVDLDFRAA